MVALMLITMIRDVDCQNRTRLDLILAGLAESNANADIVWEIFWPRCDHKNKQVAQTCAYILENFLQLPEGQVDTFLETYMPYLGQMQKVVNQHRMFETREGSIGLAPPYAQQYDLVCLLEGYDTLAVMRPAGDHFLLLVIAL